MSGRHEGEAGSNGVWKWIALGACGIALALAIALVAGRLAEQPVGLGGEPVSAGSALTPRTSAKSTPVREKRKPQSPGPVISREPAVQPEPQSSPGGSTAPAQEPVPVTESQSDAQPESGSSEGAEAGDGGESGEDD